MSIINNAPYYDKYDRNKKYTQLLAVPGRVAQAREITELQSTMKDIIKSVGDSFMNDGDVVEGCQVIPDKTQKLVTVTPGRVYMKGMVMTVGDRDAETGELAPVVIPIKAEGTELIGVKLVESIVYEKDDSDLRDPALGYENYNQSGCDRLKSDLKVSIITDDTDDNVAVLSILIDGELSVEQLNPTYSALTETLARRTYDESGSYIVEGLDVRVEANENDELFTVVVEPGKAYVHGYELTIPSSRRLILDRSTSSTTVTSRYAYSVGARYQLTTGPYVKKINKVTGTLQSQESVTINTSQGAALQHNSAYKIISVKKGDTTYDSNKYYLEQGPTSYLKWSDTDYPGDNITVVYQYEEEFQENRDYNLTLDESTGNYYMTWVSTSPLSPVVGERIEIEHEKYLARKDIVYIDQVGGIDTIQGTPDDYGLEVAPKSPTYTLPLATIMSPPGGLVDFTNTYLNITVSNVGLTRFTMSDIHNLLNRVKTMEYDQAVLSLNTEAKDYATDDKRGIFTDPFIDISKLSLDFNLDSSGEKISADRPKFDVALDIDSNMIHLPLSNTYKDAVYQASSSNVEKYESTVTLKKKSERVILSQMKATKSSLIAPYISIPQTPEVSIDPSLDTWYDNTYIYVWNSIKNTSIVSTSSRHIYTGVGTTDKNLGGSSRTTAASSYSAVGTMTTHTVSDKTIAENAITYIRPRTVNVVGTNYPPSLDNIKCYFEGVYAPMTPTNSTQAGTESGSIKANSKGSFTAKFTIPTGVRTGTRVVTFESKNKIDGYETSAYAYYKATGIARTIQRTITTIQTVLLHRNTTIFTTTYYYDPLAQTFILDETTNINSIDIYFENVPDANLPVTCEIREVSNGNITSTVYGTKTLMSDDIRAKISSNSSTPTRFTFPDSVICEADKEYAFVLKANSKDFRVYIAEIGESDLQTHQTVASNPYINGVMMSSSNNSSWTIHQKSDLKFRLIADTYESTSEIVFDDIEVSSGFCRFTLSAEDLVFEGNSLEWSYSLDNGVSYTHISPYNINVLDKLATSIKLKAKMTKSSDTNLSPILNLNSVSLSLDCYDNTSEGYYISKLISGLDPYTTLEVILDTYDPSGTSMEVYVSTSLNNATPYVMKKLTETKEAKQLANSWKERTYKVTMSESSEICRLFIKLQSNSKYRTPAFRRLRAIMS